MKNDIIRKIMYFIPNIILYIYVIIYIPLSQLLLKQLDIPANANKIMNKISIVLILISFVIKLIFNKEKCDIKKSISIVNIIFYILFIILIILFTIMTSVL